MPISHPISLAIAGLQLRPGVDAGAPDELRATLALARQAGFRAIQLNAAATGLRPRDLDRSARRDLAAALRRAELGFSGLDLWIPPEHFLRGEHMDRAVAAVAAALSLASDLATLAVGVGGPAIAGGAAPGRVLSVILPKDIQPAALADLAREADAAGVRLADHAWPARPAAAAGPRPAIGLDPAAALMGGGDPVAGALAAGAALATARLSDATSAGRTAPGAPGGRLDLMAYAVSLQAAGYTAPVVADLRGVRDQPAAVLSVPAAWASIG